MEIHATSIGTPLPPSRFHAKVHSIFSNSVNLKDTDSDSITTILFRTNADQPGDIRLLPDMIQIRNTFFTDQIIICEDRKMMLQGTSTTIDLSLAKLVDCSLPNLDFLPTPKNHSIVENLKNALIEAEKMKCEFNNINVQIQLKLFRGIEKLKTAARSNDVNAAATAVQELVGLGMGLTPSGDDILIGFLAGLEITKKNNRARRDFYHFFKTLVVLSAPKTNSISGKYLKFAASRFYSTTLINLLIGICSGESAAMIKQKTHMVLETGHTSGFDILSGLTAGLDTLFA